MARRAKCQGRKTKKCYSTKSCLWASGSQRSFCRRRRSRRTRRR